MTDPIMKAQNGMPPVFESDGMGDVEAIDLASKPSLAAYMGRPPSASVGFRANSAPRNSSSCVAEAEGKKEPAYHKVRTDSEHSSHRCTYNYHPEGTRATLEGRKRRHVSPGRYSSGFKVSQRSREGYFDHATSEVCLTVPCVQDEPEKIGTTPRILVATGCLPIQVNPEKKKIDYAEGGVASALRTLEGVELVGYVSCQPEDRGCVQPGAACVERV